MPKTTRTFSFDTETHRHILRRLDDLPLGEKSRAVREGLRLYFGDAWPEPSRTDILTAIREGFADLKRHGLTSRPAAVTEGEAGEEAEDEVLKDALLKLGL